jgi:hypothetical protein
MRATFPSVSAADYGMVLLRPKFGRVPGRSITSPFWIMGKVIAEAGEGC